MDEIIVWRLVLDKAITYSEIENLNFIDALKMNAVLDFRNHFELQKQRDLETKMNNNDGNKS